jgi:DNA-binding SARP family transcriptional activator/tetratricopeptide (TPR) repeat protein
MGDAQFSLLGSLEVRIRGQLVKPGALRQQVILAVLLLEANRMVTMGRLIDAVWDDEPPSTARSQIQICVSGIRRTLADSGGDVAVVTRQAGYVLKVPDEALDIRQFEVRAAQGLAAGSAGNPAQAVTDMRAALALWRGPAADGINSRIVANMAAGLDERRLALLGDCLELELCLGRHHEVLGELRREVAEFPLDERLRSLQMLALYRSGRQADALESFRHGRDLLAEELGLDPGERMRAMEQAILASDEALLLASTNADASRADQPPATLPPQQLPGAPANFIGREEIIQEICSLLTSASGQVPPHVPVAILTGQGGVGKTTLALYAAHLVAASYPDGQLFAQLHHDGRVRAAGDVLDGFLRSFGLPPSAVPESVEDKAVLYRSWLAERRMLVVLDDVGSLRQVQALMPGSASSAVIITTRNPFNGLDSGRQFEIPAFDEHAGLNLLASVIGRDRIRAEEQAARQLIVLCDRLPLALRIVAAKLAARPHWPIRQMVRRLEDSKRRLDELNLDGVSIRNTIAFSYESLSPAEKRLLARLCLAGSGFFPSWISAPLLDANAEDAADLLENLVTARLVEAQVSSDGAVRYHLHDLVRLFAVEHLTRDEQPEAREQARSRLLGSWLFLAGEAHRRHTGGDFGLLHGEAPLWLLPPATVDDLLARPLAWLQAERQALVSAVDQAARAGCSEVCWDLATTAVTLFEVGAYVRDWRVTHDTALDICRREGNRRGEAAVLCSLATLCLVKSPMVAAPQLDAAIGIFTELDDKHGLALALGQRAFVDRLAGDTIQAAERYHRALEGFRAAGDLIGETDMLRGLARISMIGDNDAAAEKLLAEAWQISERVPAARVRAQTIYELGELYLKRGDMDGAQRSFAAALESARAAADLVGQAYSLLGIGTICCRRADYGAAELQLKAALESAMDTEHLIIHVQILLMLTEVAILRGQTPNASSTLEAARTLLTEPGHDALEARLLDLERRIGNPEA